MSNSNDFLLQNITNVTDNSNSYWNFRLIVNGNDFAMSRIESTSYGGCADFNIRRSDTNVWPDLSN